MFGRRTRFGEITLSFLPAGVKSVVLRLTAHGLCARPGRHSQTVFASACAANAHANASETSAGRTASLSPARHSMSPRAPFERKAMSASPPGQRPGIDWGIGNYESTAAKLVPAARLVVDRAEPVLGATLVDVGCGTGNAALIAA